MLLYFFSFNRMSPNNDGDQDVTHELLSIAFSEKGVGQVLACGCLNTGYNKVALLQVEIDCPDIVSHVKKLFANEHA